jgi:hypothetical protein
MWDGKVAISACGRHSRYARLAGNRTQQVLVKLRSEHHATALHAAMTIPAAALWGGQRPAGCAVRESGEPQTQNLVNAAAISSIPASSGSTRWRLAIGTDVCRLAQLMPHRQTGPTFTVRSRAWDDIGTGERPDCREHGAAPACARFGEPPWCWERGNTLRSGASNMIHMKSHVILIFSIRTNRLRPHCEADRVRIAGGVLLAKSDAELI